MKKILLLIGTSMINSMPPKLEVSSISKNENQYIKTYNKLIDQYDIFKNRSDELYALNSLDKKFIIITNLMKVNNEDLIKGLNSLKSLISLLIEKEQNLNAINLRSNRSNDELFVKMITAESEFRAINNEIDKTSNEFLIKLEENDKLYNRALDIVKDENK